MFIKINSRQVYSGRVTSFHKVRQGHYEGIAQDVPFKIEGGRSLGGTSKEWFLEWQPATGKGYINCSSVVDALNLIDKA